MKILDLSQITSTRKMPMKKGTLQFLQDSYKEAIGSVLQNMAGANNYNAGAVYILYGCVRTIDVVNSKYNYSAGAILYNSEVYQFPAMSIHAPTGSDVDYFELNVTQYTTYADPVTFSDSSSHNVHNIRTAQILTGASGSGFSDYSNAIFLKSNFVKSTTGAVWSGAVTYSMAYSQAIVLDTTGIHANSFTLNMAGASVGNKLIVTGQFSNTSGSHDLSITFTTPSGVNVWRKAADPTFADGWVGTVTVEVEVLSASAAGYDILLNYTVQ